MYNDVEALCKVLDYSRYNPVSISGDIIPVTEDVDGVVVNSIRIVIVWSELAVFSVSLKSISGCNG